MPGPIRAISLRRLRAFSQTPLLLKKKGRVEREKEEEASEKSSAAVEDPFDFSTLEAGIEKSLEKLRNDLSKLRTGGRFNPEVLENLRVQLSKDSKATERLGDLAQVLPKGGRTLMVLVGETNHVKPIMSAIQGSNDLNLQPQSDAHNASQLNIPIPPPTKESRDLALVAASKAGETANVGVRNARGAMQKRLRAMELKKTVRPDDLKKAHKEMEKIVEKGGADIKKTVDGARKTMEQA
ncbi:Ribosome-recycling [Hyphodiscus hymeniophilus]|uniref:Ribosome-recycling n=1 Tax=Hyphodiscus hymeniophilus TaxID=353542 RepID=A0A9P7AZT7_9HELO|nr:Ribosome-recycling [Hyphodiscus hymeniophilus]